MNIAIIDLGTNTSNLLIASVSNSGFKILHQSKKLVQLGDNKIKTNQISSQGIKRVIEALEEQQKIIDLFEVKKVKVLATSAIRSAENKIDFLAKINTNFKWNIQVISGIKEADYIFKGVLLAFENFEEPSVILDIGGGSNELILAHKKEMIWKESQPTGMARVINQFALSDPIKPAEIQILQNFFEARHQSAFQQCREHHAKTLIGCSGSFDTIADIIDNVRPGEKQRRIIDISMTDFYRINKLIIESTRNQRLEMQSMDMVRIDLIVPAMVFIKQLIDEAGITTIRQTEYALREGVLFEIMEPE